MEDYNNTIKQNLLMLRKQHHCTQEELCNTINMSQPHYRKLEHGEGNPTIGTLSRIAEYYGIYVGELLSKNDSGK
jgi:transcriptional regulator with XRE-family HTH domain|nr:MAG TPA: helix-turn-helix domain protein [Caudoviricetes sp.]